MPFQYCCHSLRFRMPSGSLMTMQMLAKAQNSVNLRPAPLALTPFLWAVEQRSFPNRCTRKASVRKASCGGMPMRSDRERFRNPGEKV